MANSKSEAQILENYRVALENAETQAEITAALADIGYDSTVIARGKQLYETARQTFDTNKTEDQETVESKAALDAKLAVMITTYKLHRKKARVIFRNDDTALRNLGLKQEMPRVFVQWLETFKIFYNTLNSDTGLMDQMAKLKFSADDVTAALASVQDIETARSVYLKEIGESQEATKIKDAALKAVDKWMVDFYAVSKIALEDKPQLLESMARMVRS